jgi:hypothetical protein
MILTTLFRNKWYLSLLILPFVFASCASVFQASVFPNQCKKCVVYQNGIIVYEIEGCGANNVRLEEKAKIEAYNKSQGTGVCQYSVSCTTWKKEVPED